MTPQPDTIYQGDAIEVMRGWRDGFIHLCVSSPPYWNLRNYNDVDGQLGLEETPEEYLEKTVAVFHEVKRVLRDDGVCFVNMGDSYASQGGDLSKPRVINTGQAAANSQMKPGCRTAPPGLKPLDMVGMPWRLALALQADGWYLRSDIIWHKPAPLPESVNGWRWERCRVKVKGGIKHSGGTRGAANGTFEASLHTPDRNATWRDCPGCEKCKRNGGYVLRKGSWRPTKSHEYIFMLAKSPDYFCDAEAVKEKGSGLTGGGFSEKTHAARRGTISGGVESGRPDTNGSRNKRTVWTVNTHAFPGPHYATFPPKLIEPCILAGTSAKGVCPQCGSPWVRMVSTQFVQQGPTRNRGAVKGADKDAKSMTMGDGGRVGINNTTTLGWRPSCDCYEDEYTAWLAPHPRSKKWKTRRSQDVTGMWRFRMLRRLGTPPFDTEPAIVFDPFMGAGTTALIAWAHGRRYLGIDLDPASVKLANERIAAAQRGKKWKPQPKSDKPMPLFEEV